MGIGFDPETQLAKLFEMQDPLVEAGARNFVFFNVPPTDRSPGGTFAGVKLITGKDNERLAARIRQWNGKLESYVQSFREKYPQTTAEIYDVAALFHKVLDNPTEFGFKDANSYGCSLDVIWY